MSTIASLRKIQSGLSAPVVKLREASAASDPDENHADFRYYRRVGLAKRDVPDQTWRSIIERTLDMRNRNPLAAAYFGLMRSLTTLTGYKLVNFKDDRVKAIAMRFWDSPHNAWDTWLPSYEDAVAAIGNLYFLASVTPADATVRLAYVDPADVGKLMPRTGDPRFIDAIEIRRGETTAEPIPVKVVNPYLGGGSAGMSAFYGCLVGEDPTVELPNRPHGAFVFRVNHLPNQMRGLGDLSAAIDFVAVLDDMIAADAERAQMLGRYVGSVKIRDGTKAEIDERSAMLAKMPGYASAGVFSDREEWNFAAPPSGANEADARFRYTRNYAMSPTHIPPFILGLDQGEGNRAIGKEATDPAYLHVEGRVSEMKAIIRYSVQYAIDTARICGQLEGGLDYSFDVQGPKVLKKDLAAGSQTLNTAAQALMIGIAEKLVTRDVARRTYVALLAELGIEGVDAGEMEAEFARTMDGTTPEYRSDMADALARAKDDGAAPAEVPSGAVDPVNARLRATAAMDIVRAVIEERMTRSGAIALMVTIGYTEPEAEDIVGEVGRSFKPAPAEPQPSA